MKVNVIGLDLAKNVFQVHGVDEHGKAVLTKRLKRVEMATFFAILPPCLIGLEACASAHYWGRKLEACGHTVRLIAPQFVKPYVKSNKNDARDAEAICEAVSRPSMRFVPLKSPESQALLALHRGRSGLVKARTMCANQVRGLLAEHGIVLRVGLAEIARRVPAIIEDADNGLPDLARTLFAHLLAYLRDLTPHIETLEREILAWHRTHAASRRLAAVPGIGPITATALVASVGNACTFKNGRQFAAWIGLVPRQHSSGERTRLLGMSKRGDVYLRTLLIHGARSAINGHGRKATASAATWVDKLLQRRHKNVATVALANKNARIVWALLAHDREYQAGHAARGMTG